MPTLILHALVFDEFLWLLVVGKNLENSSNWVEEEEGWLPYFFGAASLWDT